MFHDISTKNDSKNILENVEEICLKNQACHCGRELFIVLTNNKLRRDYASALRFLFYISVNLYQPRETS